MSNLRQSKTTPPSMDSGPASRFRTARNMPSWVTESSDRVGPPPPPPPAGATDPEYEVIDVANQQYSNAPPPVPLKSPDIKRLTVMKCELCGSGSPAVRCEQCDLNLFCASCDDRYHRHPRRQSHARKPIEPAPAVPAAAPGMVKPPLPPKGEAGAGGPLPPPRKNKRPGSFHFPSPLLGRKQDQIIPTTVPQGQPEQQQKPPPPPPSPALSLREKMNSLKRFIHPSNRPLPDPPENKIHSSNSSLDTVSKRSPSVGNSRTQSSTMEKIQNNTAATLDRMTLLQQRYRQHQETMKSGDGDRSRRASLTSNTDLQSSATESSGGIRSRPTSGSFQHAYPPQQMPQHQHQQMQHQQQFHPMSGPHQPQLQSRWLAAPAPRIRSGSVASGINLLPGAPHGLTPGPSNAPPMSVSPTQRSEFGDSPPMMTANAPRSLSTSVFNLHQPPPQQQPNMWGFNPLHQAQSMAHFNPMQWNQMNAWMARGSQNGSNMSLNLPSQSPHGYPQDPSGYPPAWANAWGGMYPYPMGMMPMMPGVAMPPPRSRANSRSRAASPALSVKSRKSTISIRNLNRSGYVDDLTDDEDSDDEFRRGRGRGADRRRRERLNSTSSIDFDEPEPNHAFVRASSVKHSRFNRDRRGGSSARSLIDYPVSRKPVASAGRYEREELTRERFDKMSLGAPRKVPSDSFTNESDQEPEGNRRGSTAATSAAAGRGRSSNDGFSSPRKVTSDSWTNDSDADFERRRQAKLRTAQNNLAATNARRLTSDSLTNDSEPDGERRRQASGKPAKPTATAASSKKLSSDSDGREKPQRKISSGSRASATDGSKGAAPGPKKVPSEPHTPVDTDGEQKRRFATKQQRQRKHSSTEFIANDSDEHEQQRGPTAAKKDGDRSTTKQQQPLQQPPPQQQQKVVNGLLEFRTISPSKSDSDEQRHLKTVEIKNIINEDDTVRADERDYGRSALEDSPPPPAPVAPNCEWQCQFCTYVNEPGVKICAICCKTATIGALGGKPDGPDGDDDDGTPSRSPPPDVVQETPPHVTEVKLQLVAPQKPPLNGKPTSPTEAKKKDDAGRSDVADEEDHEMDTGATVEGVVGGSVGPRATGTDHREGTVSTDNDVRRAGQTSDKVATHVEKKQIVKEKVSTGCGPSPPREIVGEPKGTMPVALVERPGSKASTGTSPPPQDMSTQTYDTFEQVREEIAALSEQMADQPIDEGEEEPAQRAQQHHGQNIASSVYKRSHSLATPQLLQVDRPASRNSISSDTQSLPPSPHELSPQPGLQSSTRFHANTALNQTSHHHPSAPTASPSSSSAPYGQRQDETLSYLDRAIHQILQTAANQSRGAGTRPPASDAKYRTFGDLRQIAEEQPPATRVAKVVPPATSGQRQPNKPMLPATMDDHIDVEETVQQGLPPSVQNGSGVQEPESEMDLLLREAERYQFTAEELQAALTHCGEKHPVQWLRGNWNKLIETVQTLATKYGHEKRENTIGTISTTEAREALRQHRGNIWRAITECIEQRQRKYREIAAKGNFTREDIVTSLTAHHGNLEQALVELSKTQLKPFLMRIWGPPSGADNDCGNLPLLQRALQEDRSGISSDIQDFISAHVEQELLGDGSTDKARGVSEDTTPTVAEVADTVVAPEPQEPEAEPEIAALTSSPDADHQEEVCEEQTANTSNTEILKDIEALIQQMERNQESASAPVLRNIQQLLTQLAQAEQEPPHGSRAPSACSVRSQASDQRIMSKSPIPVVRPSTTIQRGAHPGDSNSTTTIEDDVRHFVEQNIQDILPNLVQQVRQEMDSVHEQQRAGTLEDDIRQTLLRADYSDSDYSNIHYFPFDKRSEGRGVAFPERVTLKEAKEVTTNGPVEMVQDDQQEYANIQQFLHRALTNERTTTAFDRYKRKNYHFDSSSDEARHTAESTDYYDLVSINEKLLSLFNKPAPVKAPAESEPEVQAIVQPVEAPTRGTIGQEQEVVAAKGDTVQQPVPAAPAEAGVASEKIQPQPVAVDATVAEKKGGMKKRRGTRVPVNKSNYLSRRPVKSSSESDYEGLAHANAKTVAPMLGAIDHVEELRHVVENIEQIERVVEADDTTASEMGPTKTAVNEEQAIVEEPIYMNLLAKPDPMEPADGLSAMEPQLPVTSVSNEMEYREQPGSADQKQEQETIPSGPVESPAQVEEKPAEDITSPSVKEETRADRPPVKEEGAQESSPALGEATDTVERTNGAVVAPPEPPTIAGNGVDSSPTGAVESTTEDEVLVHSAKLSNNLSELVLDTKRLIQQMKDEINSDIATFNEDDAAYEDDFYEDEYEGEWEGEEEQEEEEDEEEEWDSNEEYDADENGDFLEYEDDDDDGSVMFSEMTIIDSSNGKSRSVEQSLHNELNVADQEPIRELILPKINLAVVRENERNSASEVSDLPLDSDFNDALSVIEHSVSEMRSMLQLTEEALGPLPDLGGPLRHASSVETLQNSPEQSEISEMTLVPDPAGSAPTATDDASEQTLVAEENQPMTMKEVQTLLNAKAVIGGFLKNVQKIEQIVEETINDSVVVVEPLKVPEEADTNHNGAVLIYDSVRTSSTEATENKPASVIERNSVQVVHSQTSPLEPHPEDVTEPASKTVAPQNTPTQEIDRLANEHTVNNGQQEQEIEQTSGNATDTVVPENSLPVSSVPVVSDEGETIPDETNGRLVVQTPQNAIAESNDSIIAIISTDVGIQNAAVNVVRTENTPEENGTVETIPDPLPPPSVIGATIAEGTTLPSNGESQHGVDLPLHPITPTTATTLTQEMAPQEDIDGQPEYVNVNVLQTLTTTETDAPTVPEYATVAVKEGSQMRVLDDGEIHTAEQNDSRTHAAAHLTNGVVSVVDAVDVRPDENGSSSSPVQEPNKTENMNAQFSSLPSEAKTPVSADKPGLTEAVQLTASIETEASATVEAGVTVAQSNDRSKVVNDHRPPPDSSGDEDDCHINLSSSCTEVHPSQVIIHEPHPVPPEAPPRTTNIYQNVPSPITVATSTTLTKTPITTTTATSSASSTNSPSGRKKTSSKLIVKIANAKTLQSDDATPPTTPSTPTGTRSTNALSKVKKSELKKKTTGPTSPTSSNTNNNNNTSSAADSSDRKASSLGRKKSIGSPFGTVQTSSVKALQKEFLTRAKESPKPSTSKVLLKPSKLAQPKMFGGERASSYGSGPLAGSSKASTPASNGSSSSSQRSTPAPNGPEAGPSTSYTSEQMLKKKYRETCFSDDYQTTDDDEDESHMTVTESERTIIKSLIKPYEPDSDPPEVQARKILDDGLVQNLTQADLAVQLIELRYAKDSAIWAATQCHTVDEAKDLLQKECELCLGVFPMNETVAMLKCTHTCCLGCAKEYFTQEITNRSITNCNCPYCKEPDLNGAHVTEDDVLEYFSNLDILLKSIVDESVHDLFQRKIRDRTLTQDPNFKWCVHCSSGFFAGPKQRRLICPDCGSITCASCRKPWESQHEGLSCEKYAEWKEANDPELQAEGVQRHLQSHGISCPNCKFRYSLARGGCMHFTCTQCKFEFCYGCNKPFMMGAKCSVSAYCAKLGLHAHHPRNCLFYLRDKEPRDLQNLLQMNGVAFDTEPSEQMKQELMNGPNSIPKCPIPLQKETPAGLMDMICSGEVPEKHAGLCRTHYVEYLVGTVSKAQIDPLPILDLTDCVQELRRGGIPLPERGPWDTDQIYREMCLKIVKAQIPLNN